MVSERADNPSAVSLDGRVQARSEVLSVNVDPLLTRASGSRKLRIRES